MYQLYYSPAACSMAIHVLLNELGQPVELHEISLRNGQNRSPEFLKINPRGQVPVLVDAGQPIREGAAIMLYLMDKHASNLMPTSGLARATALEWLCWGNATLHAAYSKAFFINKNMAEGQQKQDMLAVIQQHIQNLWDEAESRLANNAYLCGDAFSCADILMTVIANWQGMMPFTLTLGDNVKRVLRSTIARPSYQAAMQKEQVTYQAAA